MSVDMFVHSLLMGVEPFKAQNWHRGNFGRGAGQNDTGGVQPSNGPLEGPPSMA